MDNTYITQNAEILAKIATIGSFVVAVSALIFSYLQSRFRKHEIKRAYYCEVLELLFEELTCEICRKTRSTFTHVIYTN